MNQYSTQLASAAALAQSVLASLADPEDDGEFTIGDDDYEGVLNLRTVAMEPGPNGLKRIEELEIVATRAQWATAPEAAPRFGVTALGREWWCTKVSPAGPCWSLTCVPA
ncbi:MAG: hypothetical protein V4773_13460 [Verrucomicrobiota bacterium]